MNSVFFKVWKYPILLTLLTMFGLIAALVGTGLWHGLAWLALAIPLVTCFRFAVFPSK